MIRTRGLLWTPPFYWWLLQDMRFRYLLPLIWGGWFRKSAQRCVSFSTSRHLSRRDRLIRGSDLFLSPVLLCGDRFTWLRKWVWRWFLCILAELVRHVRGFGMCRNAWFAWVRWRLCLATICSYCQRLVLVLLYKFSGHGLRTCIWSG